MPVIPTLGGRGIKIRSSVLSRRGSLRLAWHTWNPVSWEMKRGGASKISQWVKVPDVMSLIPETCLV